jgi:hypothetical protein
VAVAQVHVWLRIHGRACPLPSAPRWRRRNRDLRVDGGRDNIHDRWNRQVVQR